MNLPNLIIAGVPKAGTTSLHHYLSEHPQVTASSKKETFFWNRDNNLEEPDLDFYAQFFSHNNGNESYLLESTPRYFYDLVESPSSLKKHLGEDLKVIVVLRDPIQRLFSFFKFKKRSLELPQDMRFATYIEQCQRYNPTTDSPNFKAIQEGFYDEYIHAWFKAFDSNLLVLTMEEFKDTTNLLKKVSGWLSLDSAFYDSYAFVRENQSIDFKNKGLHQVGIKFFRTFEQTLNRVPAIRKSMTAVYYRLNGQPFKDEITDADRSLLKEIYTPHDEALKLYFQQNGIDIPEKAWLNY